MRTPEGDQLLGVIRQLVHGRVPPAYEDATIEVVCQSLVTIMNDPQYYSHLRLVQDLQSRVIQLERVIALYQQQMPSPPVRARAAPKPRKAVSKKPPGKPPVRKTAKKPPLPYNVKAFKKGAAGR
jgi:hypothetical protein